MEKDNKYKYIAIALVVVLFILGQKYKELKNENEELEYLVDEYDYALRQANDNIEEANYMIEDAQGYAWESYEDMGYILENLTTVDTVREP